MNTKSNSRSRRSRSYTSRVTFIALAASALLTLATVSVLATTGAIFTTDGSGGMPNGNIYDSKADVYLNGGPPANAPCTSAGLPDGDYYFQVTDPSGTVLLSSDPIADRQVTVFGGVFVSAINHDTNPGTCPGAVAVQLIPFADTPNNGGEYKVWITLQSAYSEGNGTFGFVNADSKTDNFKVKPTECVGDDCNPQLLAAIIGLKFYDTNADGVKQSDELVIPGWRIEKTPPTPADVTYTSALGEYSYLIDTLGIYTISEVAPPPGFVPNAGAVWLNTTPTSANVTVTQANIDNEETVDGPDFGNVCLGAGGGLTLGFWSNKNGAKVITGPPNLLPGVLSFCLRNGDGSLLGNVSLANFQKFLLNANATNMANMLSAQLAAMELNVASGRVSEASLVYAPCLIGVTGGANAAGFISIGALMDLAETSLCANGYTPAGSPDRAYQECLKNALDQANNNLNFIQVPVGGVVPCASTITTNY
jgi:hypothetical protein